MNLLLALLATFFVAFFALWAAVNLTARNPRVQNDSGGVILSYLVIAMTAFLLILLLNISHKQRQANETQYRLNETQSMLQQLTLNQ